jgi:hypothetical protein
MLRNLFAAGLMMVVIGLVAVVGLAVRPAWPDELKEWFRDQWDPAWRLRQGGHYNFSYIEKRLAEIDRHEIAKKATFGRKRLQRQRPARRWVRLIRTLERQTKSTWTRRVVSPGGTGRRGPQACNCPRLDGGVICTNPMNHQAGS